MDATARRACSAFPDVDATDRATWDRWVQGLPTLALEPSRVLVVAPHPDDETFGCGGLIAASARRGAEVVVVTVTDGGGSHPGRADLAARRRQEQADAVTALGCWREPWWLALPDGGVAAAELDLGAALVDLADGADLIVAPWPWDRHPDHEATGRVAIGVGAALRIPVITYPVWLWRWGAPSELSSASWSRMPLGPDELQAKRTAMDCYPSQTTDLLGETIVDAPMLDHFAQPVEVYCHG